MVTRDSTVQYYRNTIYILFEFLHDRITKQLAKTTLAQIYKFKNRYVSHYWNELL